MQGKHFTKELKILNYGTHQLNIYHQPSIQCLDGELNVCSKCISFFPTYNSLQKHSKNCSIPFTAIYQEESFKISKIENLKTKQNISLISQLFIKSKTVYYEVHNYDFFIVSNEDVMGYFSRFKGGENSLNCLLVLPCYQGQGWGTILFDYCNIPSTTSVLHPESHLVPDQKSPEKPYSKKAIFCFRKYWKFRVIGGKTINEISLRSNLTTNDVILGLELNGFDFKLWKLNKEITVHKPRMLMKRVMKLKNK